VGSPIASNRVAGMMFAMGLSNVEAGPGTVRISGGYFSAPAMQELAKGKLWSAPVTAKDMEATMALAHSVGYGSALDQKLFEEYSLQVRMNWQTVLHGATPKEFGGQAIGVVNAGENLVGSVRRLISAAHGDKSVMSKRAELLAILDKPGGVTHPQIRAALEQITGAKFESLAGAFEAGRGGAAAMGAAELADLSDEAAWLYKTFSPARPRVAAIAPPSTGSPVWPEFVARAEAVKAEAVKAEAKAASLEAHRRNNAMPASFYKELQSNRHYLLAKEAILEDEKDSKGIAKRHLQRALMETQIAGGDKYRMIDLPVIDPTATVTRPGAAAAAAQIRSFAGALGSMYEVMGISTTGPTVVAAQLLNLERQARERDAEVTSWAQEVKNEKATGMAEQHKAKLRPRGPGTVERAIGFGEQESALASIHRSLKSTERALSA